MAWIDIVQPDDATGLLKEEYDRAVKRAGRVSHVLRISSLAPKLLHQWVELYVPLMHGPSPLTRAEREMVAVVVSQANDCHY